MARPCLSWFRKILTHQVNKNVKLMDIIFANNKLKKELNQATVMCKAYGSVRAKRLQILLAAMRAAPHLGVFAPPMSMPHRCHELKGNRRGQLSMDLGHPYRLLFEPSHHPRPERVEGGLDWHRVTVVRIRGIEDTHG